MSKFVTNLKASVMATGFIIYGASLGFKVADAVSGGAASEAISDTVFKIRYALADRRNARMEKFGMSSKVCFAHEIEALNRDARRAAREKKERELDLNDHRKLNHELLHNVVKLKKAPEVSMKDLEKRCAME